MKKFAVRLLTLTTIAALVMGLVLVMYLSERPLDQAVLRLLGF